MTRLGLSLIVVLTLCSASQGFPETEHKAVGGQVIIQIGGRLCEYHRKDVDAALRRHKGVETVEFLNDHGTVLVGYDSAVVVPGQLAESVERALAMGIGCKAWVDRGGLQSNS